MSTFTPRRSHISGARFTCSPLLASRLPAGRRSAPWDRAMAGLLLCVDSLLNRCYLLVSGSVRARRGVVGRLGLVLVLRLGLGLALGLQLGIGIGFRRNHSWSSTFTPRHNHSLCHLLSHRSGHYKAVFRVARCHPRKYRTDEGFGTEVVPQYTSVGYWVPGSKPC